MCQNKGESGDFVGEKLGRERGRKRGRERGRDRKSFHFSTPARQHFPLHSLTRSCPRFPPLSLTLSPCSCPQSMVLSTPTLLPTLSPPLLPRFLPRSSPPSQAWASVKVSGNESVGEGGRASTSPHLRALALALAPTLPHVLHRLRSPPRYFSRFRPHSLLFSPHLRSNALPYAQECG